jgi:hypothetical protein
VGGSVCAKFVLLSSYFPGGTEENKETLQRGQSVTWSGFEPGTFEYKSETLQPEGKSSIEIYRFS